jgi:hypothetical protein
MSLSRAIAAALDDPQGDLITATDGRDSLALDAELSTPVGVTCRSLEFRTTARPSWAADELKAWGGRLAARVTYLMEPLVVVETDAEAAEVALRSKSPTARGEDRGYYEARLDGSGRLRMQRIAFDAAARRRRAASFQLTREVIERLADDLVASVG